MPHVKELLRVSHPHLKPGTSFCPTAEHLRGIISNQMVTIVGVANVKRLRKPHPIESVSRYTVTLWVLRSMPSGDAVLDSFSISADVFSTWTRIG